MFICHFPKNCEKARFCLTYSSQNVKIISIEIDFKVRINCINVHFSLMV